MGANFASLPEVERFLASRLTEPLPGAPAQRRFAPHPPRQDWSPDDRPVDARRAAALILLYPTERGVALPLTVRHHGLPYHAGQLSLPGGRIDAGESSEAAALRETWEEIGVPPADVRVLGPLSTLWVVVSNHLVQPFVGIADARPHFRLAEREVTALIELPLSHLHDTAAVGWDRRLRDGLAIDVPYFSFEGHQIWGATAMVLSEFAALFESKDL